MCARGAGGVQRRALRVVLAVLALVALAQAEHARPRRADMSPVPFVMGSRYGRSPERAMAPRNDRFFMGSRYGKRSGAAGGGRGVWEGCEGVWCRLLCRHAPRFYRCLASTDNLHYKRRRAAGGAH